jgi:hypothetical protein
MKTRLFFTAWMASLCTLAFAQTKAEMSENVKSDEVPAVVLQAAQNTTGSGTEGRWELFYLETTTRNSNVAKFAPEFYRYSLDVNGNKMEYFFKPDGTLFKKKGEASGDGEK